MIAAVSQPAPSPHTPPSPPLPSLQVERICYLRVKCVHCESGDGIEGFTIKAYDVTDRVANMPEVPLLPHLQVRNTPQHL